LLSRRHDFETQKVLPHFRVSKSRQIRLTLGDITILSLLVESGFEIFELRMKKY